MLGHWKTTFLRAVNINRNLKIRFEPQRDVVWLPDHHFSTVAPSAHVLGAEDTGMESTKARSNTA